MSDLVVVAEPSTQDYEAFDTLMSNGAGRLALVRARSEKWVGAVAALTGLITTVLVVKGPDSVTNLTDSSKRTIAVAITLGLVLLAFATYKAYAAAFGIPGAIEEIDPNPLDGLATRLASKQRTTAAKAQEALRDAIIATFIATTCLAVAIGVAWFSPARKDAAATTTCLSANGRLVARIAGGSVAIVGVEAGTTIAACP